jgi:hypothetical protein
MKAFALSGMTDQNLGMCLKRASPLALLIDEGRRRQAVDHFKCQKSQRGGA